MRIPHGLNNADAGDRPPVFLIHSFSDSGVFFALHGQEESPAFYLADSGYDVWLLNARGTSMSLGHETLDWRFDREYWQLSWLDYSIDYRDTIQFIIDNTNYESVAVAV